MSSMNYYSGRVFERGEMVPEYVDTFAGIDWNAFSEDQLIFDGDTVHVCRF